MRLSQILQACSGRLILGDPEADLGGISIDTRTLNKGDLFIAIKGERFDGHDFIPDAIRRGAKGAVVERGDLPYGEIPQHFSLIEVKDTVRALGDIANWWRRRLNTFLIAITGSVGKTSTKDILASILSKKGDTFSSKENLNNLIGVPLNILSMEEFHRYSVIEMGMNRPGEIKRLTEICAPNIGVITNVGPAHVEGLGSVRNVILAKLELVETIGEDSITFIDGDNKDLLRYVKRYNKPLINVCQKKTNDYVYDIKLSEKGAKISVLVKKEGQLYDFWFHLMAKPYLLNASVACSLALYLGLDPSDIQRGIGAYKGTRSRFEVLSLMDGSFLVDDSYNANPISLKAGLFSLKELFPDQEKILIIGDMLELGKGSKRYHREAGRLCAKIGASKLIAIGSHSKEVLEGAKKEGLRTEDMIAFQDVKEALPYIPQFVSKGSILYVKGSHKVNLSILVDHVTKSFGKDKENRVVL